MSVGEYNQMPYIRGCSRCFLPQSSHWHIILLPTNHDIEIIFHNIYKIKINTIVNNDTVLIIKGDESIKLCLFHTPNRCLGKTRGMPINTLIRVQQIRHKNKNKLLNSFTINIIYIKIIPVPN